MNKLDRRQFLAWGSALAAAGAFPVASCALESIRTRLIPGTSESLPVIGLGAPDFFYKSPPEGDEPAKAVIRAMVEMGGRMIDTPPFFRPDPPVVGRILREMDLTNELFLTGKIPVHGKDEGVGHLEKSIANLNKRPIDLLMVHNMKDMHNHWPTLKDWKEAGRVRFIGVSLARPGRMAYNNYATFHALESFMKAEQPDFIMVPYSIHHPEAGDRILPLARDMGIAVICIEAFKTDDDGALFGLVAGKSLPEWASEFDCESWAQFALKYVVSNPAVTTVVVETSKVKHVIDNMRAGYGRLPDDATRKKMSAHLLSLLEESQNG